MMLEDQLAGLGYLFLVEAQGLDVVIVKRA